MFDDITDPHQSTLVRALVAVGIGLPLLIEVATFGGMLSHHLAGGQPDATADATTPEERTAVEENVVGDEVLTAAQPTVEIRRASVVTTDDGWQFVLTLSVSNPGPEPTAVRLDAVTTRKGVTVDGRGTTGRLAPGESGRVTGSWLLPAGERPASVRVAVVTGPPDATETTSSAVPLGDIPVSNR